MSNLGKLGFARPLGGGVVDVVVNDFIDMTILFGIHVTVDLKMKKTNMY